jgi:hypothetical protein
LAALAAGWGELAGQGSPPWAGKVAFDPLRTRRKRAGIKPPVNISDMAVHRQGKLLDDMFKNVDDEDSAQRYSYAKGVQKKQRMKRGGSTHGT